MLLVMSYFNVSSWGQILYGKFCIVYYHFMHRHYCIYIFRIPYFNSYYIKILTKSSPHSPILSKSINDNKCLQ